ncbi:MAG: dihydrofolate reductase family protein [Chloroflexi bacterium]|nr:dihydrofolate reductase family protein [Chloroflexota bacterium]MBI3340082.1 dihydrofolate reductase family protein [Chloroflexota bacterium]
MDRPYVHINVAATADGKIDTFERKGAAISSARDKERVDRLRAEADAVMVGGRTLRDEDPKLTVKSKILRAERMARGLTENPTKVGVASRLDLKPDSNFLTAGPARIFLFTTPQTDETQRSMLRSLNAEVYTLGAERVDLIAALRVLKENGINRLMVEGGAALNFELMRLGLVDELTIYVAPMIFGGEKAPTTAAGPGLVRSEAVSLKLARVESWDDGGVVLQYKVEMLK